MISIFGSGTDLISLRLYSSCSVVFVLLVGVTSSKKPKAALLQNQLGMKFGRIVLEVNMHRLASMTLFHAEKCCHLVAHATSVPRARICVRLFLIHCAFVLVYTFHAL